jgi:hypothetical protein
VWSGKYESDNLWGHKAGVKALKLLPSQGVLLTGVANSFEVANSCVSPYTVPPLAGSS